METGIEEKNEQESSANLFAEIDTFIIKSNFFFKKSLCPENKANKLDYLQEAVDNLLVANGKLQELSNSISIKKGSLSPKKTPIYSNTLSNPYARYSQFRDSIKNSDIFTKEAQYELRYLVNIRYCQKVKAYIGSALITCFIFLFFIVSANNWQWQWQWHKLSHIYVLLILLVLVPTFSWYFLKYHTQKLTKKYLTTETEKVWCNLNDYAYRPNKLL